MAPSLFAGFLSSSLCLLLPLFPQSVSATFPFNSKISQPVLKHSNEVSFDPLGVAAVLHNPRAETSAARLYTQPDRAIFRWPHTMMIGGVLPPLSVLVAYLTSKFSSIDPAVSMCLKDRINLPVRSTMAFPDIPISLSNAWLRDILAFKPSHYPENDFAVAEVGDSFEQLNLGEPTAFHTHVLTPFPTPTKPRPAPLTILDLLDLLCGLLILTGMVFSVLVGDVWARTLFLIYTLHWLAGTIISFNPLIKLQENKIVLDTSTQYAVYQRPEGGTVVFKGRKDTLERWARMTWQFDSRPQNHFLHWFWTITGTLAAVASVACMVNMTAYLQLGFLGVLGYSSSPQTASRARGGTAASGKAASPYSIVGENRTRTMGIIRATLTCGLDGRMWFDLKLLPKDEVFEKMLALLDQLRTVEDEQRMQTDIAEFRAKFGTVGEGEKDDVSKLAGRIAEEVKEAWRELRV
ncbi:hypothetical protein B0H10DRAFT_2081423 [Mycena sp. CBHHK59/15]|nr:hypothetical protein B0H10DRAFT_2081423 [Mycena sp. CBHHK59/15]